MSHILYAEAHYQGAHRDWIDGYRRRSGHQFTLLTMPGGDWQWRLHGGAMYLAQQFHACRESLPPIDLVLVNGMASASLFLASTRSYLSHLPIALYIQENQLNFPPPPPEEDRWQNGAIVQVTSAFVADIVAFNGEYLKQDFLTCLKQFLSEHDYTDGIWEHIAERCLVLPRGIDLIGRFGAPPHRPPPQTPITFLWNHRWAYEKGVQDFAAALRQLHTEAIPFQVILAGDPWKNIRLRDELAAELGDRVVSLGNLEGAAYVAALCQADVMVACSKNEPLGVSMLEAMYMGCLPVLPARGSFPYVLPPEHHDLLYDGSLEGLIERLRFLALHPQAAIRPSLSVAAAIFDWSNLIESYDRTFEELIRWRKPSL